MTVAAMVRVTVASDEDLPGGTVDLASLVVRYFGDATEGAITLVAVDVNGEAATGVEPVRIHFDSLSLESDVVGSDSIAFTLEPDCGQARPRRAG